MSKKPKVIVIVGPTAVGKSDLAVHLAKKYHCEIISADSRQVYKGLHIGSGKIREVDRQGIRHFMLDVADPRKRFTVVEYKDKAKVCLQNILAQNKIPLVVGGTGFYVQLLVDNLTLPKVAPDETFRQRMEDRDTESLYIELQDLDPDRALSIDAQNKQRIIRALEIIKHLGKVPRVQKNPMYLPLYIGIDLPYSELQSAIHERQLGFLEEGLIEEVINLHEEGISFDRLEELGLEYRYVAFYLQKRMNREDALTALETATNQYAKRQRTWFRKDKRITWFDPRDRKKIEQAVESFLKS